MARKIRWSIYASEQLKNTLKFWIEQNGNNRYANFLFDESSKALNLVSKFPSIGRTTTNPDIRRILIDKKYGIYYSFDALTIDIKLWRSLVMSPDQNQFEN